MHKTKSIVFLLSISLFILNCDNSKTKSKHYEAHIGDTPFNPELDNSNFKFCDSTNVLHKRALIRYNGGERALKKEIIEKYVYNSNFEKFTGYFVIRFAVNCNNESGRFRMQILNNQFQEIKCSSTLQKHILDISKSLKGWNHAFYKGKSHDGYRFFTIKMENGKIINV